MVLTLLGTFSAPVILQWMGTPEEVFALSVDYFAVYFAGISGLVMYNLFSGIMRAVGDSKHPLYFLIISSILNVILDLLFIGVFHWGVAGAAWATVTAQAFSALLALYSLCHVDGPHQLILSHVRFHWASAKAIIRYGVPTGVQNSIISLANVVVQSNINAFGPEAMAGCGAYSKLEGFAFLPIMSFNMAISTFVGQNIGAKDYDRTLKGSRFGILCCVVSAEIVGIIFFLFADTFIRFFDSNPEVIAYGAARARTNALFYFLLAYSHAVSAVCRGGGKPAVPMNVMLVFWCILRVGFLMVTAPLHNIQMVYWVYPLTWLGSSLFFAWYYPRKTWLYPDGRKPQAVKPEAEPILLTEEAEPAETVYQEIKEKDLPESCCACCCKQSLCVQRKQD